MNEPNPKKRAQALEAIAGAIPDHPVTQPGEVNRTLAMASTVGNLISPVQAVDYIPQMHAVSFRYVLMNWTVETYQNREYVKGDCYNAAFTKGPNLALSQQGVLSLWRAAGGRDVSTVRIDDRTDALYAEYQATVALQGIDGKEVTTTKSREVDLRPGAPETASMKPNQLAQAKPNVARNAETKAQLRAYRAAMDLQQMYTIDRLEMPFIVPVLVPLVDTSDPAIARLVAAKALGVIGELYGASAHRALPSAAEETQVDGVVTDAEVVEPTDAYDDLPPEEPTGPACDCPCGCVTTMSDADVEKSTSLVGAPRCLDCFPSPKRFNFDMHAGVTDLELPKRSGLTVAKLQAHAQKVAS